ncbi:MAG: hypothetical protein EOP56_06490 [Sphingobacteriales bacterium]|nr:MAG: hypothetical protein EOP56_06490 [Sphingobacteriales bacterium]
MSSIFEIVKEVNDYISSQFHLEMSFYKYEKYSLVVVGSEDLIYYHTLEIRFDDIDFVSGKVDWSVDNSKTSFGILGGDDLYSFNLKNGILEGYTVFYFLDEDGLYTHIVAKTVSMALNTVTYRDQ